MQVENRPLRAVEREVVDYRGGEHAERPDLVTVEEPLEIRLHGEAVAVIMRTPLDDFDLVAGFLLTEGLIDKPGQLGAISYCMDAEPPNLENIVEVRLADGSQASTSTASGATSMLPRAAAFAARRASTTFPHRRPRLQMRISASTPRPCTD